MMGSQKRHLGCPLGQLWDTTPLPPDRPSKCRFLQRLLVYCAWRVAAAQDLPHRATNYLVDGHQIAHRLVPRVPCTQY